MKLLFTRRHHIGSHIIRAVTWSEYSHVDLLLNESQVIGAAAFKGVVVAPISTRLEGASKAILMGVPVKSVSDAEAFAYAQLGKPYDWPGVIGIGLHRDWQHDDKWSCAEFAAATLRYAGTNLFADKFYQRVTPQDLLMLPFGREVVKT